jgi:hypothetical protein
MIEHSRKRVDAHIVHFSFYISQFSFLIDLRGGSFNDPIKNAQ